MFQANARSAFDALLYPPKSDSSIAFLQSQFTQLGPMLDTRKAAFYEQAQAQFQINTSDAALEYARQIAASSFSQTHIDTGQVISLYFCDDFQNASMTMQRWMMANPALRKLRNEQRCDGWSSTYIDNEPEKIGMAHYDYRRVVSDVLIEDADGGFEVTHISEMIPEDDRELSIREQRDILASWHCLDTIMARLDEDPTDPAGGML